MYVIFYDYDDNLTREKVKNNLKRIGFHAQWSVFETDRPLEELYQSLIFSGERYRVGVFKVSRNGKIIRIGKPWERRPKRVF